ncbi:MAG TPA: helix-turn-helix transcriptional regulator [Ktedonobacterales bacterium]|nr:helix-turn-helix transcriptional regulator [Ktedonobacterales bacterium]
MSTPDITPRQDADGVTHRKGRAVAEQSRANDAPGWAASWGQLMRTARQVAGLSLSELAASTGLSKGYLSKLESGDATARNPSRATLAALARALPSFRPLAHMLEPADERAPLALSFVPPQVPDVLVNADGQALQSPVRLGWREIEVVVALLALERAAAVQPITRITLARAVSRPPEEVEPILDALVGMGVLGRSAATRPGGVAAYARGPEFSERTGIRQLGDALILAAALLAQSPRLRPKVGEGGPG